MKPMLSSLRLAVVSSILFFAFTSEKGHADILFASDGAENDKSHTSVSVSGSTVIVGADSKNGSQGGAYIYQHDGNDWEETILSASDGKTGDGFGYSASVSGNTAIVGANDKNGNQGGAYIYQYDGANWNEIILSASDGTEWSYFGYSVSVSGDTAIVGAEGKNGSQGGAYIYQYDGSGWEETILSASDGKGYDHFGYSVSVSGNTAIVGANGKNGSQGGAYIYQYDGSGWEETILSASDGKANNYFGQSVSVSGDTAIVGAIGKNNYQGGAYIYQYDGSGWEETILSASDGKTGDNFGSSVSVSGDTVIVGAAGKNSYQGGAYIYQYDGENRNEIILSASNGKAIDQFGSSVSLDGDMFTIGEYATQKVYVNTVGALTTFNKGSQIETVVGLNFTSPMDWVIGADTSGNMLMLTDGTADISAEGKAVYVGQNAGANGNILVLMGGGALVADAVYVGSVDGNTNNMLALYSGADWSQLASIYLTEGNILAFSEEFWTSPEQVFAQLGDTKLYASYAGEDVLITLDNYMDYLEIGDLAGLPVSSEYSEDTYGDGTYVMLKAMVIPEPTTSTLWLAAVGLLSLRRRK